LNLILTKLYEKVKKVDRNATITLEKVFELHEKIIEEKERK